MWYPDDATGTLIMNATTETARRSFKRTMAEGVAEHDCEFLVEFGHLAETILAVARHKKADLIAMGIRHSDTPAFQLRSSTAYQIMANAHCPVLTSRERT
jgi:nucleotide-binding universal stress UspA family protein